MGLRFNPLTGNLDLVNAGDVVGPSSSTDEAITRFDGTTGKLLQNSSNSLLDDSGNLKIAGYSRFGSTSAPANTTAGDITGLRLSIGNASLGSSGRVARFTITDTTTAAGANTMVGVVNTLTPASDSAAEYRAIYFQNLTNPATGVKFTASAGLQAGYFENRIRSDGLLTTLKGIVASPLSTDSSAPATIQVTTVKAVDIIGWNRPSGTTTATITNMYGIDTANMLVSGGATIDTIRAYNVANPGSGNTVTNLVGLDIAPLTRGGTLNVGVRIDTPSGATNNYALQLLGNGGTAASGITFGSDTNLYRSTSNTLKTDDSLIVTGTTTSANTSTTGGSGTLQITADTDGSDFNIFHSSGTKTLAFYGTSSNTLNISLLDGDLNIAAGKLIKATSSPPSSASSTGTTGQIEWDSDYMYVCTATNTWKRVAIATW